jgi:hypothetical protein
MKRFFERRQDADLERRLRRERPVPRDEFVAMLSDRLAPRPQRRMPARRLGLAAALTAAAVAAFAGTGGFAYAASAVSAVASAAKVVVAAPVAVVKTTPASTPAAPKTTPAPTPTPTLAAAPVVTNTAGSKPDDKQYGHKTQMCHNPTGKNPVTITVDDNAVPALRAQGDTVGPCPPKK